MNIFTNAHLYRAHKITKKSIEQYNEFNTVIIQNGRYIYEFGTQ